MSLITHYKCDNCGKTEINPINSMNDERHFCGADDCRAAAKEYEKQKKKVYKGEGFRLL